MFASRCPIRAQMGLYGALRSVNGQKSICKLLTVINISPGPAATNPQLTKYEIENFMFENISIKIF